MEKRDKFEGVNPIKFNRYFQCDEDCFRCLPLRKEYPLLRQVPSNKGANLKQLHIHIMNIQGWLRGIHHHCDKENLQGYLDEYHFRYNRRSMMGSIFNLTLHNLISQNLKQTIPVIYSCDLNAYTIILILGYTLE